MIRNDSAFPFLRAISPLRALATAGTGSPYSRALLFVVRATLRPTARPTAHGARHRGVLLFAIVIWQFPKSTLPAPPRPGRPPPPSRGAARKRTRGRRFPRIYESVVPGRNVARSGGWGWIWGREGAGGGRRLKGAEADEWDDVRDSTTTTKPRGEIQKDEQVGERWWGGIKRKKY